MNTTTLVTTGFLGVAIGGLLLLGFGNSQAQNTLLPFQGHLTGADGQPVVDGAKVVQFKMYDAPVSGTAVWAGEVHKLSVNEGLVNTMLGTKTSLSGVDFSNSTYLEITVDADGDGAITAADPPLLPRQVIVPAVFAAEAANSRLVEGVDMLDNGALNPAVVADGSFPLAKLTDDGGDPSQGLLAEHIASGAVTGDEIRDQTITLDDLAESVTELLNLGLNPAGSITAFGGAAENVPDGWLLCDGTALDSDDYPTLHQAIQTAWGNGTTGPGATPGETDFNLPDLRGRFLRGVSGESDRDPDKNSRVEIRAGANAGNFVGSAQLSQMQSHQHFIMNGTLNSSASGKLVGQTNAPYLSLRMISNSASSNYQLTGSGGIPDRGLTNSVGGAETRPINVNVNYIIKF
ncbi:tail fiber protein [Roseibacillus ishigakijimensis]|uniref:Tail fiber protein n=1 Tax=Roseibacillus ishigakijimensis TaxID=454146 RepID=A0A934VLU6_9BACT|nr:tail fiber protein [Roseibacillus ishigakijimensis]MBK1835054.1 tail fiber protein [Roseibacillus ishigakijimensis]